MADIQTIFKQYQDQARNVIQSNPENLNVALTTLENQVATNSGLSEGDRLELRAYMVEFRRQSVDGYEAAANQPHLSNLDSAPFSGESGPADT